MDNKPPNNHYRVEPPASIKKIITMLSMGKPNANVFDISLAMQDLNSFLRKQYEVSAAHQVVEQLMKKDLQLLYMVEDWRIAMILSLMINFERTQQTVTKPWVVMPNLLDPMIKGMKNVTVAEFYQKIYKILVQRMHLIQRRAEIILEIQDSNQDFYEYFQTDPVLATTFTSAQESDSFLDNFFGFFEDFFDLDAEENEEDLLHCFENHIKEYKAHNPIEDKVLLRFQTLSNEHDATFEKHVKHRMQLQRMHSLTIRDLFRNQQTLMKLHDKAPELFKMEAADRNDFAYTDKGRLNLSELANSAVEFMKTQPADQLEIEEEWKADFHPVPNGYKITP